MDVDEDVIAVEDGALMLYDSTDDESYQEAKRKAESSEIDSPFSNKHEDDNQKFDVQKNKKCRTSFGDERNAKRESLENSLKDHNVLLADTTKKKYSIEQRRLALKEEDCMKKEDRRIAMEEACVEEQKEERAMNREFMMSVISMMKAMSENLVKHNDSKK
jgi:hypothetical protein